MKKHQGNIFNSDSSGGYSSFIRDALSELCTSFPVDSASFYEYDAENNLLHMRVCNSGGFSYEHEDHIMPVFGSKVYEALEKMIPIANTKDDNLPFIHMYYPFSFESGGFSSGIFSRMKGMSVRKGLIRLERRPGHSYFSEDEKKRISEFLENHLVNYYRYEYASLLSAYRKNLKAVTSLAEVFAKSLNKQSRIDYMSAGQDGDNSLRSILSGVQMHFGFDRVRLFLVVKNEGMDILRGELSVDITGKVRDLSIEQIPLEPGFHRFADILLQKSSEAFLDSYKQYVVYVPLVVGGENIGLMIGDNFTSQQPIENQELALLRSLGTQMALAVHNITLFKKVQTMAKYDALTRLPLRTYFDERLNEELVRSKRYEQKLSFMFVDLDLFKRINDTYSHQTGDEVLKAVANTIMKTIRQQIDFPGRFGGDEMVIFLPQSSTDEAEGLARRLQSAVRNIKLAVPGGDTITVSVSIGIATCPDDADTVEMLKNKADQALYWVKEHGRGITMSYKAVKTGIAEQEAAKQRERLERKKK